MALKSVRDDRIKLVAYADDLAVLITSFHLVEIQTRASATLETLSGDRSSIEVSLSLCLSHKRCR